MSAEREVDVAIVGAGLVGSLLALFLTKRGYSVEVFERRPDMRKEEVAAGRSINLNISRRGLEALERVGIIDDVLPELIPMYGRMMHSREGELTYQPYGKDDTEYGNSVSRAGLNILLMNKAEETGKATLSFNMNAREVDFDDNVVNFETADRSSVKVKAKRIIGTDGSASRIRKAMMNRPGSACTIDRLEYGYKELLLPASQSGEFQIDKSALHIWPRGAFMLIALANLDGSFTCTLFLPYEGEDSFAKLVEEQSVSEFFKREFPDFACMMPDLAGEFLNNPTGHMDTIKCLPWQVEGRVLLMGDASHAIVPFFGQGMNCGFEDVSVLDALMQDFRDQGKGLEADADHSNWTDLFDKFVDSRKDNCDAIADMALDNFIEMRDRVADPKFLLAKKVEKVLEREFPGKYISRYSLVTFTSIPYRVAQEAGEICREIISELLEGLDSPETVDRGKAERLIDTKLAPVIARHEDLVVNSAGK